MSKRSAHVRALPCLPCTIEGVNQPFRTQEHHLNRNGWAGKKRRGDDFSVPLCEWHHLGKLMPNATTDDMTSKYGPSLAKDSRLFRFTYGSDDSLLALTDKKLANLAMETA